MVKVVRFAEECVRPMGRTATGVRGMKLVDDDKSGFTDHSSWRR